ncbi:hypothetical protein [uncultured Victivallis sp.]|uniref:hypothetical protein n=1 Tax=uncultured Victivallis sp. TaxID=354118 RepID=UPI002595D5D9|nr:hypothetical protein [uncultured Victivallis sp.]
MINRRWIVVASGLFAAVFTAIAMPPGVRWLENGTFRISEGRFGIMAYNRFWDGGERRDRKSVLTATGRSVRETLVIDGVSGLLTGEFRQTGADSFSLRYDLNFPKAVELNSLHGSLDLPIDSPGVRIDGNMVVFPERPEKPHFYKSDNVRKLEMELAGGRFLVVGGRQPLSVMLQDNRPWGEATCSIRFYFSRREGRISQSSLELDFQIVSGKSMPVEPAGAPAAEGYPADVPILPRESTVSYETLEFRIPAERGRAIYLENPPDSGKAAGYRLKLPRGIRAGAINLLHAGERLPVAGEFGELVVRFADGSFRRFPLFAGRDIASWNRREQGCANALPVWQDEPAYGGTVLYVSGFRLDRDDPVEVCFRPTAAGGRWLIPAVTLTEKPVRIAFTGGEKVVVGANAEWIPVTFTDDTVAGSPLDFSSLADAPAGKYGFVRPASDGTMTFENAPEKRLRIYGVNLCFSANYPEKKFADALAERLVRCGYNGVRFHHQDTDLLDPAASNTLTFDPEKLDRLDYLFAALKKRGLYLTTDFYTNRELKPGDNVPECDFSGPQLKTLMPISRAARENWKEYVRRWMRHRNPYTGLTWAEDPALFCVNIANEDPLCANWNLSESSRKCYLEYFAQWKKAGNPDNFTLFLSELQGKCLDELQAFLKDDLRMETMVTSLNFQMNSALTVMRDRFEAVDVHSYFDHPSFPETKWAAPYLFRQQSAVGGAAKPLTDLMACRIFNKPFLVTEINFCNPNRYRAEYGPLIGGYAALQEWSGIFRFTWTHSAWGVERGASGPPFMFDIAGDPLARLSDRIVIAMFRRGDVSPARQKFAQRFSANDLGVGDRNGDIANFGILGLTGQVGAVVVPRIPKDVTVLGGSDDPEIKIPFGPVVSSTGELKIDAGSRSFTVSSPRSESITLERGSLEAGRLSVHDVQGFQTVAAIALDEHPLAASGSILVIHLTNVLPTGMTFEDETMQLIPDIGRLPILVRRLKAEVGIAAGERPFRVTALNGNGKALGEVKGVLTDGVFRFTADPGCFPGGVMAYHLTR